MTAAAPRTTLRVVGERLGVSLSEGELDALLAYLDLIAKWNKVYNLTALREPADMLTHHVLDSLAVIAPLRRQVLAAGWGAAPGVRLLDVGSGAGLPGVVIAICCPAVQVICVDTVSKKASFIKQVALALKLPNLAGLHARVESIEDPFEVICSRAFASLSDFTQWSVRALAPHGIWMAMKGKNPSDELATLSPRVEVFHVEPLQVPGLDAERCIVWLRQQNPV